jgi:transcriptional regulator with XRE-family HTH domain
MTSDGLGERIRTFRLASNQSLRGFAQAIGVSPSLVSQIENGRAQPSVSTLYAIVGNLDISFNDLLDPPSPEAPAARDTSPVQRGIDNPVLIMQNGVRWERLAAGTSNTATAILVTYEPGASSSALDGSMQHQAVEFAYLIEGELHARIDDDTHVLRAGDSMHFDSMRPHVYANHGTVPARGVWFVLGTTRVEAHDYNPVPADPE